MNEIKNGITVRMPSGIKKFRCIGGKCEDNCCIGWDVDIDKKTYQKYQRFGDTELKEIFDKQVYKNKYSCSDDIDFARVRLLKGKRCPFLNGDNLCRVQLKCGEGHLSNVCATYPRITSKINAVYEMATTISCPEAARMILLNPDGISFIEEKSFANVSIITSGVDTRQKKFSNTPVRYFLELRDFSIRIVQNRKYPLWKRMAALGKFMEAVQKTIDNGKVHKIPEIISKFDDMIESGSGVESIRDVNTDYGRQLAVLLELVDNLDVFSEIDSKRYVEFTTKLFEGIGYDVMGDLDRATAGYEDACRRYYEPFMESHEYILENFIVNFMFKDLFPFSDVDRPFDAYMMLVVRLGLIKLYLAGIGAHGKGLSEDVVVDFIQVFVKTVEHHKTYLSDTADLLISSGSNTFAVASLLIR